MTLSVHLRHAMPDYDMDVRFDAPPGVTVLFGRSGSGKTTIVNAVAGLLRPEAGRVAAGDWVLFDSEQGHWLTPARRRLGYIFQDARLFPHLTVRQNLLYGRWFAADKSGGEKFEDVVEMLGIGHILSRRPGGLSGGETQRVAIGRALLANPKLILADEPLAALDEIRKAEILPYFERLRDEVSVPILYVSHSAVEVARLATTVIALENGRVAGQGPAAEVLGDPSVMPTGVRDVGALIEAKVARHCPDGLSELDASGATLIVPKVAQAPGQSLRVRIAAQEVLLALSEPRDSSALNVLSAVVADVHPGSGPGAIVTLTTPAGKVLARVTKRSVAKLGLAEGVACYAIVKTVAIAPENVGGL